MQSRVRRLIIRKNRADDKSGMACGIEIGRQFKPLSVAEQKKNTELQVIRIFAHVPDGYKDSLKKRL